ncbi:MAG TPA: ABC transporter permease [Bryobacteraceae bacterium]|nr:ABC transporter permease [Bryobacteraceae bacterium]
MPRVLAVLWARLPTCGGLVTRLRRFAYGRLAPVANRRAGYHPAPQEREQDLERELRSHLESEAAEQQESGLSPDDARYASQRALGNMALLKEEVREMWGMASFERLAQDLRYGVRTLRKSPGFTLAAVLTLALGIGATSAIFSVVYGVLLRDLPYPDADRLALVHVRFSPQNNEYGTMSIADYLDWKSGNRAFEDPAIFMDGRPSYQLTGAGDPIEVIGTPVTESFFSILRSGPMLGQVFHAGDSGPNAPHAIVLSESLWRSHFGANPSVVGQVVNVNGGQMVIRGVMPASFRFPASTQLWTNMRLGPPDRRGPFPFTGIARLKLGVTFEQAQAETNVLGRNIELANPGAYGNMSMPIRPLREALTGNARPALLLLFGAVFLLLLIATVNVASLMLVRVNARQREMAVRLSLGAARARLLRQLLTESLLLGSGGGLAGLALAWFGVRVVRIWNPGNLPRIEDVHLDLRALAFAFFVAVLCGVFFGLAPAVRCSRADLTTALRQGARTATMNAGKRNTQSALAVAEVALSFTLLIGGGLLLRSFLQLDRVSPGFQAAPQDLVSVRVSASRGRNVAGGTPSRTRYSRMLERVANLPGVVSAALSDSLPPGRSDHDTFQIEGQPWSEAAFPSVTEVIVSPSYFRTLQIPLRQGRYFTEADEADPPRGIIISESLARRYFPDGNPIGRQMAPSSPNNRNAYRPIVGVVGDVKYTGLESVSEPAFYRLYTEFDFLFNLQLVVRSSVAPSLPRQIEREIRIADPNATHTDIHTLADVRSASLAQPRFRTALIAGFAGVALLLSAIGVYGVIAFSVAMRTNEIGIRMALGAQRSSVLKQIVGNGAKLALAGVAIGCGGALFTTRVLAGLLFRTSSTDPVVFAAVTLLLVVVAIVASLIPAVRAIGIDPVRALRCE